MSNSKSSDKIIIYPGTSKFWFIEGLNAQLKNGSYSIEYCSIGIKYWNQNGEPHRENGPAIENSKETKELYQNEKELSEKEFKELEDKS